MSPRGRSSVAMSSPRPFSPSGASTSSSVSTLPPYGSPPPKYADNETSPALSAGRKSRPHSGSAMSASAFGAPYLGTIELPKVKDSEAITTQQSRQHMAEVLFKVDRSLDFNYPLPDLTHLGFATFPVMTSVPISLPFSTSVYSVKNPMGVRVHDIAHFVYTLLHQTMSEKDALRCNLPQFTGRRLIDALAPSGQTRFGGLSLSSLGGGYCVWLVKFVS